MAELAERLEKLPELLEERVTRYTVPGASLAVLCEGQSFETAAGVVNRNTGVETTSDAVFQIGSITKLFTTTLIMQLVEEGRVELDEPVRTYLPEFQLGDDEAARSVTLRQLLTHSSGIDGDFFQDSGRGDDCVERYVLACSGLGQLHPPAQLFSYCNSGFVIAGRIVEKLRGMTWDAALQRHLLEPIGAKSMHTLPEQALYYRAAVDHVHEPESGEFEVASEPFMVSSSGPAGSTPFAAARQIVEDHDGRLVMTSIERRPLLGEGEQTTVELSPVTESTFGWPVPGTRFRNYVTFLEFGEDGRAGYLYSGGRTAPRVR